MTYTCRPADQPNLLLSLDGLNPGISTNTNPLYTNAPNTKFNNFGSYSWSFNGQNFTDVGNTTTITGLIPGASNLPVILAPSSGSSSMATMANYIFNNRNGYKASSYGSVAFQQASTATGSFVYTIFSNFTALHAAPLYTNLVDDAIMKFYGGPGAGIKVNSHPLPVTAGELQSTNTARWAEGGGQDDETKDERI
jgi:hypothetical protein